MATALASLVSGRLVRDDTAMTGELTLTGQVLPIGGLKEKALAAQDFGISRVIAPKLNEQDIEDIPEHLRKDIEFIFVERIEDVLDEALLPPGATSVNGAKPSAAKVTSSASARDGASRKRKTARAQATAADRKRKSGRR
jgi:ATP-dependent Lon protease